MYVETSAAAKLLVEEPESDALSRRLDVLLAENVPVVSSYLLETELRRLALRGGLSQTFVSQVLNRFDLLEHTRSDFLEAGLLPGTYLRSLDALHIAMAVRAEADSLFTYDIRQAESAQMVGLEVLAPA